MNKGLKPEENNISKLKRANKNKNIINIQLNILTYSKTHNVFTKQYSKIPLHEYIVNV